MPRKKRLVVNGQYFSLCRRRGRTEVKGCRDFDSGRRGVVIKARRRNTTSSVDWVANESGLVPIQREHRNGLSL